MLIQAKAEFQYENKTRKQSKSHENNIQNQIQRHIQRHMQEFVARNCVTKKRDEI